MYSVYTQQMGIKNDNKSGISNQNVPETVVSGFKSGRARRR